MCGLEMPRRQPRRGSNNTAQGRIQPIQLIHANAGETQAGKKYGLGNVEVLRVYDDTTRGGGGNICSRHIVLMPMYGWRICEKRGPKVQQKQNHTLILLARSFLDRIH